MAKLFSNYTREKLKYIQLEPMLLDQNSDVEIGFHGHGIKILLEKD